MVENRLLDLNQGLMRKMIGFEAVHEVAERSPSVIPLNNYVTPLDRIPQY